MACLQLHQKINQKIIRIKQGDFVRYIYEENRPIGAQLAYTCNDEQVLFLKKDKYHWWDKLKVYFSKKVGNAPLRRIVVFKAIAKGQTNLSFQHKFRSKTVQVIHFSINVV